MGLGSEGAMSWKRNEEMGSRDIQGEEENGIKSGGVRMEGGNKIREKGDG